MSDREERGMSDREERGMSDREERGRRVVVGVGGRRGAEPEALVALVRAELGVHDLAAGRVDVVATLDRRAGEPGVRLLASRLGARVTAYSAVALAAMEVPSPSDVVRGHTGTAGVAEAAVLAAGAHLLCHKRSRADWTVAIGLTDIRGEAR